jgi:hypothetical protein
MSLELDKLEEACDQMRARNPNFLWSEEWIGYEILA